MTAYEVAIQTYRADARPGGGFVWEDHPMLLEEPSFRVDGLEPGQTVGIRVRGVLRQTVGALLEGPWSDPIHTESLPMEFECANEREVAMGKSDFVLEWDGTPLRVDIVRNFPDFITEADLVQLLVPVGEMADKIELQLGYRIMQMGDVIPVPEVMPPGWNEDPVAYRRNCWLPRDKGQMIGFYMDGVLQSNPAAGAQAHPDCGVFTYLKVGVHRPGWNAVTNDPLHEIFHVFGFGHPEDYDYLERRQRVLMSPSAHRGTAIGAQQVTEADIDILRCIFPERG